MVHLLSREKLPQLYYTACTLRERFISSSVFTFFWRDLVGAFAQKEITSALKGTLLLIFSRIIVFRESQIRIWVKESQVMEERSATGHIRGYVSEYSSAYAVITSVDQNMAHCTTDTTTIQHVCNRNLAQPESPIFVEFIPIHKPTAVGFVGMATDVRIVNERSNDEISLVGPEPSNSVGSSDVDSRQRTAGYVGILQPDCAFLAAPGSNAQFITTDVHTVDQIHAQHVAAPEDSILVQFDWRVPDRDRDRLVGCAVNVLIVNTDDSTEGVERERDSAAAADTNQVEGQRDVLSEVQDVDIAGEFGKKLFLNNTEPVSTTGYGSGEDSRSACFSRNSLMSREADLFIDQRSMDSEFAQEPFSNSVDLQSIERTDEHLQNWKQEWTEKPALLYKSDYPFVLEGFVLSNTWSSGTKVAVYTKRLGLIELPVGMSESWREGNTVRLVCTGPNVFRCLSLESRSCTMLSLRPSEPMHLKGWALMGLCNPKSVSSWSCWSDSLGLIICVERSARLVSKKHPNWNPSLQVVKIKAERKGGSSDRRWEVIEVLFENQANAIRNNWWPREAFFICDLRLAPMNRQGRGPDVYLFRSDMLHADVVCDTSRINKFCSATFKNKLNVEFSAVVIVEWLNSSGLSRQFRAIAVAEWHVWDSDPTWRRVKEQLLRHPWEGRAENQLGSTVARGGETVVDSDSEEGW